MKTQLSVLFLVGSLLSLSLAAVPVSERQALVDLYTVFNGTSWSNSTNWLVGDPCENSWFGVTCDGSLATVTELNLFNNRLAGGPIPDLALPNLDELYLRDNQLSGSITDFSALPSLTYLNLDNNQLNGTIPDFSGLPFLIYLFLSNNLLVGQVPDYANLPRGALYVLDLSHNDLCGTLPSDNPVTGSLTLSGNTFLNPSPAWCGACATFDDNAGLCCPAGQYLDSGRVCQSCHGTCGTCDGPNADDCSSCASGDYLEGDGTCQPCDPNCLTCSGPPTTCLSCSSPLPHLNADTCEACPDGTYDDGANSCEPCDGTCHTCNGPDTNDCLLCIGPLSLDGDKCVNPCPDGTYDDGANSCQPCDPNCLTCSGSPTTCLSCSSPLPHLNVDTCEACPAGEYDDGLDSCQSCDRLCATCNGPNSDDCIIAVSVSPTSTAASASSMTPTTSFPPSATNGISFSSSGSATASPSISITPKESLILPPVDMPPSLVVVSPSPSSKFFPISTSGCSGREECETEPLIVALDPILSETIISLNDSSGNIIGEVIIPNSVAPGGVLSVTVLFGIDDNEFNNVLLGNSVIDIILVDIFSNPVTQLINPIEICVAENRDVDDASCLGYFNTETNLWECEDRCLKKNGNQYCGETDHLTSFALLLNGIDGKEARCDSNSDYVLAWISMALLIAAILVIIVAVAVIEVRYRVLALQTERKLRQMIQRGNKATEHNL